MFQNDLWKTKRLLSQNRTNLRRFEAKVAEDREKRHERIRTLEAHLAYLESAELEEAAV